MLLYVQSSRRAIDDLIKNSYSTMEPLVAQSGIQTVPAHYSQFCQSLELLTTGNTSESQPSKLGDTRWNSSSVKSHRSHRHVSDITSRSDRGEFARCPALPVLWHLFRKLHGRQTLLTLTVGRQLSSPSLQNHTKSTYGSTTSSSCQANFSAFGSEYPRNRECLSETHLTLITDCFRITKQKTTSLCKRTVVQLQLQ